MRVWCVFPDSGDRGWGDVRLACVEYGERLKRLPAPQVRRRGGAGSSRASHPRNAPQAIRADLGAGAGASAGGCAGFPEGETSEQRNWVGSPFRKR
jgi:hypothetical protein